MANLYDFEFFKSPGASYNFWVFMLAVVGVCLGIWGLIFAYVQIARTLTAARAARDTALKTAKKFEHLNALMDINKLASLAGETINSMRAKDFRLAEIRAQELRIGISQFRNTAGAKKIDNDARLEEMVMELATVEKDLRKYYRTTGNDAAIDKCMDCLMELHVELHGMTGIASQFNGA